MKLARRAPAIACHDASDVPIIFAIAAPAVRSAKKIHRGERK